MKHLLETIPHDKLMKGVLLGEFLECGCALKEFLADEHQQAIASPAFVAAEAYALGIREGVHRERARRKRKAEAQALPTIAVDVLRGGDAA